MKIEQGKFYRTRDGRKVGPMEGDNSKWVSGFDNTFDKEWRNDGTNLGSAYGGMTSADDLMEEWVETPKTWSEMTDAEKGALLLAEHEGKDIECFQKTLNDWVALLYPMFNPDIAYRVKPEPKRETVQLYGPVYSNDQCVFGSSCREYTHRITFDLIDGKPVCDSIRMELIE